MLIAVLLTAASMAAAAPAAFSSWGRESLAAIERDHRIPNASGYYEDQTRQKPAFAWGEAILLLAYAKAAQRDPQYVRPLDELIEHLDRFWVEHNGIGGYDCLPAPRQKVERFYDDNAWIAMGLIDAFCATGKKDYLRRSEKTLAFCLSGIDPNDGGVWWKESWDNQRRKSKNTCSVAPTAFACLRYAQVTQQKTHVETAAKLMEWLDANLKDTDSLYFDSIRSSGRVGTRKWSYNSAMPLRCYVLLYELTGDRACLDKALRLAKAAEVYWYEPSGAVKCEAMFAFTLVEGWLELAAAARDNHWQNLSESVMLYIHENVKDENGRYAKRWDNTTRAPLTQWNLLYPAAAARGYWTLAK